MMFSESGRYVSSGPILNLDTLAASESPRFSSQGLSAIWQNKKHSSVVAAVFISAMLLLSCSTALVTENTLDVSTTTDDLTTRQIIFNLVKTKQNPFALPSQVQITQGQISAITSITPSVSSAPVLPMITSAIGASNTSTTVTNSNTMTRPAATVGVSGVVQNQDSWNATFIQDPEQLQRLRLLYQYGAHQTTAFDLLCNYPVPQRVNQQQQGNGPSRRYVRIVVSGSRTASCHPQYGLNNAILVGEDPDPAFLRYPDCIICAHATTEFDELFKKIASAPGFKIWKSEYGGETEDFSDKNQYVAVVLNSDLWPNALLRTVKAVEKSHWAAIPSDQSLMIDWMSVVKDGVDPIPDDARRVGGSNGYTVYIHPLSVQPPLPADAHFSAFVLAIMESLQQPVELAKTGAAPPPIVQSAAPR